MWGGNKCVFLLGLKIIIPYHKHSIQSMPSELQQKFLDVVGEMQVGKMIEFEVSYCHLLGFEKWVKNAKLPVNICRCIEHNIQYHPDDFITYKVEKTNKEPIITMWK